jgi:hypothetical protein
MAEGENMNGITYAKSDLESAFGLLNVCAGGMDDAQYNWAPGGTCNTIAKSHVHAVSSIDFFINATINGGQMLWAPVAQEHALPQSPLEIWKHEGTISKATIDAYAASAQKAALDVVARLSDSDLDREIDTPFFGKKSVAWLLQLVSTHSTGHGGDIAAVKGMQGLKGLPF